MSIREARVSNFLEMDQPLVKPLRHRLDVHISTTERGGALVEGVGYLPSLTFHEEKLVLEEYTLDGTWRYPRELLSDAELEEHGYTVVRPDLGEFNPHYPLIIGGEKIQPRDEIQQQALDSIRGLSGHLVLSPGKGKTVIALKDAAEAGRPFIVFVHNGGLYTQWEEQVANHLGDRIKVAKCRGPFAKWKDWQTCHVAICTFQSFSRAYRNRTIPQEFLNYFGTIIFDEAHHVKADTFADATWAFPGRRLALTATPLQSGMEEVAYAHIGPILYEDTSADLTPTFSYVPVTFPMGSKVLRTHKSAAAHTIAMGAVLSPGTKDYEHYFGHCVPLIRGLLDKGHNVLVLGPRVASGQSLYEEFKDLVPDMAILDGSVPFEDRPTLLNRSPLTFATQQIGEEGLDRKDLSALVCLYPFGSGQSGRNKLSQAAGRVLRALPGKLDPEVYVLGPVIPALPHMKPNNERAARSLGFDVRPAVIPASQRIAVPSGIGAKLAGPRSPQVSEDKTCERRPTKPITRSPNKLAGIGRRLGGK